MKRYVMIAVAIALIVSSLIYLPENTKPVIAAGAGNGENAEISTIEDFASLLNFFTERQNNEMALSGNLSGVTLLDASLDEDEDKQPVSKHSSVTLTEDTYINNFTTQKTIVEYDYKNGNHIYKNIATIATDMNRSLTVYMTKSESYYVSKGFYKIVYEDLEDSKNSYTSSMVFDIQIYLDGAKTVMRFNSFDMDMGDSNKNLDLSGVIGKWIEVPAEFAAKIFSAVDQVNRDTLSMIQDYINGGMNDFNKVDNKYTLEIDTLEENDTKITIDLNDDENSYVGFVINGNEGINRIYMVDSMTFSNVDNTIIEIDFDNIEVLTSEEMIKIFGGEK